MSELSLSELGRRRTELRERLSEVTELIKVRALADMAQGKPEAQVARESGVDRMTIRKWQGKPRP